MRRVDKQPAPRAFTELRLGELRSALTEVGGDRTARARAVFEQTDSQLTRDQLLAEQRHLCVFCESRLKARPAVGPADVSGVRRAHWEPIAVAPERALDWDNLYASCSRRATCDERQGDLSLRVPPPCEVPFEDVVRCTRGGVLKVLPTAGEHLPQPGQLEAIECALGARCDHRPRHALLNLNDLVLVRARKAAIMGARRDLERRFPGRRASPKDREQRANRVLADRPSTPYISAIVAWLRRDLAST